MSLVCLLFFLIFVKSPLADFLSWALKITRAKLSFIKNMGKLSISYRPVYIRIESRTSGIAPPLYLCTVLVAVNENSATGIVFCDNRTDAIVICTQQIWAGAIIMFSLQGQCQKI